METLNFADLMKEAQSNASVQLANATSEHRITTTSEWETIKDTFLHNLSTTISHIKSGNASPDRTPFVRSVCKDGDMSTRFDGVFLGYAKNKKVKKLHAFDNGWFRRNEFGRADADSTLEILESIRNDENTLELALKFLKLAWQKKVASGQKGRAKATANAAISSGTVVHEGAYEVAEAA